MVKPLKKRTMTLDRLQRRVLKLIKETKKQLEHQPYETGRTDQEFMRDVLVPLQTDILQDIEYRRGDGPTDQG